MNKIERYRVHITFVFEGSRNWDFIEVKDKSLAWIAESKKFWSCQPKIVIVEGGFLSEEEIKVYANQK